MATAATAMANGMPPATATADLIQRVHAELVRGRPRLDTFFRVRRRSSAFSSRTIAPLCREVKLTVLSGSLSVFLPLCRVMIPLCALLFLSRLSVPTFMSLHLWYVCTSMCVCDVGICNHKDRIIRYAALC